MSDKPDIFSRGSITKRLFAKHTKGPSYCSVDRLFRSYWGHMCLAFTGTLLFSTSRASSIFLGLNDMMILSLVFSKRITFGYVVLLRTKNLVCGLSKAHLTSRLASKHLLHFN